MNDIIANLVRIKSRIEAACRHCGRSPESVQLLLATKTVSPDRILSALSAGRFLIGENKVQELKEKYEALRHVPHETHFIGHLQSNKVREVIQYADCIQSVDRLGLAEKLHRHLELIGRTMDVFIQVNTSYEDSKFGISPGSALDFAREIMQFDRIRIRGLMTIGLFSADEENTRKCFHLLAHLQQEMLLRDIPVHELSMGMSGDLEVAIQEGATIVRVGTAVFGRRSYPDSYYWQE